MWAYRIWYKAPWHPPPKTTEVAKPLPIYLLSIPFLLSLLPLRSAVYLTCEKTAILESIAQAISNFKNRENPINNINWNKWSSIAEIVSSVAILVTLVYLSIQTQQNTDAINAQSRQSLFEGGQEEHPVWIENPDLTLLIIDSSIEMTLEQKVRLDALLILALARREFAWRQYQAGLLDEDSWQSEAGIVSLLLGTERTRHWWNAVGRLNFDSGFVAEAEAIFMGKPAHPYWEGLKNL